MSTVGPDVAYMDEDHSFEKRIIGMYHSCIGEEMEEHVLREFTTSDSTMRCLVSTVAFGMGVNVSDIAQVIHWGASKSILSFWQEVGRCARDGRQGQAYLYATLPSLRDPKRVDKAVIELCSSLRIDKSKCIRVEILKSLILPEMDLSTIEEMETREKCESKCENCVCACCTCCSLCKAQCLCNTAEQQA